MRQDVVHIDDYISLPFRGDKHSFQESLRLGLVGWLKLHPITHSHALDEILLQTSDMSSICFAGASEQNTLHQLHPGAITGPGINSDRQGQPPQS